MKELINEIEGDFYQLSLAQEQLKFLENFAITQTISSNKESIRVALEHHNAFFGIKRTVSLEDAETSLRLAIEEGKGLISRFIDKIKEKIHKLTMLLSTKNGKVAERVSYLRGKMKDAEFSDKKITKTSIVENFIEGKKSVLEYISNAETHSQDFLVVLKKLFEESHRKEKLNFSDSSGVLDIKSTELSLVVNNKKFKSLFHDQGVEDWDESDYEIYSTKPLLGGRQVAFLFDYIGHTFDSKITDINKVTKAEIDSLDKHTVSGILDTASEIARYLDKSLDLSTFFMKEDIRHPDHYFLDHVYLMILNSEGYLLDTVLACLDYAEESM